MKKTVLVFAVAATMWGLSLPGCKKDTISPDAQEGITFRQPAGWPQPFYNFSTNTLTDAGFELGRKLFYDTRLSRNNTISCGTCHQQFAAFANADHKLSHGIDDLLGNRNSPPIFNLAWHPTFFWDGGVINLENQPINPIENHVEMDMKLFDLVDKLKADEVYRKQFGKAFGDETVNTARIFKALAQFMGVIVSADSRYDKLIRKEAGSNFTAQEQKGLTLFRQQCESCHKEPLFSDFTYRNNGLMPDAGLHDSGRAHVTSDAADLYKFKVPSLRNIALTAPYMHDGRLATLDAVIDHYRTGITQSPTLDPRLAHGIVVSDVEKADLIAFLHTLTDTTFTNDKRFAETQ